MKQLLVIAIALASVNAFATRARVAALANSPHLVDTQTVYNNPADMFSLGNDYVTLETGLGNSTSASDGAEGMVVRTMGDAKMALSLGHDSANASGYAGGLRASNTIATVPAGLTFSQQNPVEFSYGSKSGDMAWAGTLVYSNFQDKTAVDKKETSTGLRFGARAGNWDASLRLGLVNTVQTAADGKFTGTAGNGLSGGYQMDSIYFSGGLTQVGFKVENAASVETAKYTATSINLGAMTSVKKDGSEFFYGASINQTDAKESVADSKIAASSMPMFIGVEVDAASWLTLRGSVTQTLQLLNNVKVTTGTTTTTELAPGNNNTVVAAGAGLKFNKINVDGTLQASSAATSQQLNGNSLLTTLGMTYNF